MKSRFLIISFLCAVLMWSPTVAQFPQYHHFVSDVGLLEFEMDEDYIWIAGQDGLIRLDRFTGTHVNYTGATDGLVSNHLRTIVTDKYNRLFITTPNSVQTYDKNSVWTHYDTLPAAGIYVPHFSYTAADNLGNVYASGGGYYIHKYNSGVWDTIINPFIPSATVIALDTDSANHLWMATSFYGIARHDGTSWQIFDSTNSVLPPEKCLGMTVGKNNVVYAYYNGTGLNNRLYAFSNGSWTQIAGNIYSSNVQVEMYADHGNNIYITSPYFTVSGVIKFDGTSVTTYNAGTSGLPSNSIKEFRVDSSGVWYYICDEGFFTFDGTNHKEFELSNCDIPYTSSIQRLVIDRFGIKWYAGNYGVVKYDGNSWQHFHSGNSGLSYSEIKDIFADDENGLIWVTFTAGSVSAGIAYYDGNDWTMMLSNQTGGFSNGYYITRDLYGNLWFVGSAGVVKHNPDSGTWNFFANGSGLFANASSGIVADSLGNVLVTRSYAGVQVYNGGSWQYYDASHFGNEPGPYFWLTIGSDGLAYVLADSTYYMFNGVSWSPFVSPCIVNDLVWALPSLSTGTGQWFSSRYNVSRLTGNGCQEFHNSMLPDLSGSIRSVAVDHYNNYWFTYWMGNGTGITVYNSEGVNPESLNGMPSSNLNGFVYKDAASNGVFDSLVDVPFSGIKILLLPDSMIRYTNQDGYYNFAVPPGSYTIKMEQPGSWQLTSDSAEYHVQVGNADTTGLDFGLMDPTLPSDELVLSLTNGIPRCNTQFPVTINYWNTGVAVQNGELICNIGSGLSFVNSVPLPDSVIGNT